MENSSSEKKSRPCWIGDDRGHGKDRKRGPKVQVPGQPHHNNRAGDNAPLIAEKISNRLHPEKQQSLF